MIHAVRLNWPRYFGGLSHDETNALVDWLERNGLQVEEFMEIVDQVQAAAPERWFGQPPGALVEVGRSSAERHAGRTRSFAIQVAAFDDALFGGAFSGDVAPWESCPASMPPLSARRRAALLGALARVAPGEE